jgi:hypothetical protein
LISFITSQNSKPLAKHFLLHPRTFILHKHAAAQTERKKFLFLAVSK